MATEQPAVPRKPKPQAVSGSPWLPVAYELADVTAIQALHRGEASADQQRRAMDWIVKQACATYDFPFRPGPSDRETNIALGRQFVGQQIVKMLYINPNAVRRSDPRADPPEG